MKILFFTDIHGNDKELSDILNEAADTADIIICGGDLTDMYKIPEGFTQLDMADMIVQKIIITGKPFLCVPGNHDPYEVTGMLDGYKTNLHNKSKKLRSFLFIGFGGAETPFNTIFEPTENDISNSLSRLNPQQNSFILVVHQPPKNTKQDRIISGEHVGSPAIRKFIQEKQPILTLTGHIHEGQGIDYIGKTAVFNPGPAFEGKYGIIEITDKKVSCISKTARSERPWRPV